MDRTTLIVTLATVACSAAVAAAQQASRLERVDQVFADQTPLSTSLRRLDVGLNHPSEFQDVFRVPGEPEKLMRVHGGLRAVFSQSLYSYDRDRGLEAVIPPNTVFRIGPRVSPGSPAAAAIEMPELPGLPPAQDDAAESRPNPYRVVPEGFGPAAQSPQPRLRSMVTSRESMPTNFLSMVDEPAAHVEPLDLPGTIIGDEQYRARRLRELMHQAAAAE